MTTEPEKSRREIAQQIVARWKADIGKVVKYEHMEADIDKALRDRDERWARLADKEAREWRVEASNYKPGDSMRIRADTRADMAEEIASAIRGKSQ